MSGSTRSARIAIIGVGNEFRHDDGVAWAVIARLRERADGRPLPPGAVLSVCDGDPGRLIGLWENADLAVRAGRRTRPSRPPGAGAPAGAGRSRAGAAAHDEFARAGPR